MRTALLMLSRICLSAMIALATQAWARPAGAQPILEPRSGHYYEKVEVPQGVTWADARQAAEERSHQGLRGHLATITSAHELEFITQTFKGYTYERWIGGYQVEGSAASGTGWRWITGEPWELTNWNKGEPNDVNGISESALEIYGGGGLDAAGSWNDDSPYATDIGYIVEYEKSEEQHTLAPAVAVMLPAQAGRYEELRAAIIDARDGLDGSGVPVSGVSVVLFRYARAGVPEGFWNGTGWVTNRSPACFRPATPQGTKWQFFFPGSDQGLEPGSYAIRARAVDRAGNTGYSDSTRFTITGRSVVEALPAPPQETAPPQKRQNSLVRISTASARASDSSIFLSFTGTLDADSASDTARYNVEVDGTAVRVESAACVLGGVVLRLPQGAVPIASMIQVTWRGLLDARGRVLNGQIGPLQANQ